MTALSELNRCYSGWMDGVAGFTVDLLGRFCLSRTVRLVEEAGGEFVLYADEKYSSADVGRNRFCWFDGEILNNLPQHVAAAINGSRVELILRPERFISRPLTLPARASEFIGGIVRAQIDRLTPWPAEAAAFGWSVPVESEPNQISITVVATARQILTPFVRAISDIGARSVAVFTALEESKSDTGSIKVLEQSADGLLDVSRIRRALVAIIATCGIATGAGLVASVLVGARLEAQNADLAIRIAAIRSAVGDGPSGSVASARRMIARRKYESLPSVIVLEALSQILPEHTYLTELRVDGKKLRLIGITRDGPSLIGIIEQSGRFSHATFFAPTTRSESAPGERFHIEADIQPNILPRTR